MDVLIEQIERRKVAGQNMRSQHSGYLPVRERPFLCKGAYVALMILSVSSFGNTSTLAAPSPLAVAAFQLVAETTKCTAAEC